MDGRKIEHMFYCCRQFGPERKVPGDRMSSVARTMHP
jgi:hypothetical protein